MSPINSNTAHACVDCGATPIVTLVATVVIGKRRVTEVLCPRCWIKRGAPQ